MVESMISAHAILLGDRLSVDRAGQSGVISTTPFCFRKGDGYVVAFRYGAAVFVGLSEAEESEALAQLASDAAFSALREEERLGIELRADEDEGFTSGGRLQLRELTPAHVLVLADVLAKSVARKDSRPLLVGQDPKDVLTKLAAVREPVYALADLTIESGEKPHGATVAAIIEGLTALAEKEPT